MNKLIVNLFEQLISYIKEDNNFILNSKERNINNFRIIKLKNVVSIIKNYPKNIISSKELINIKGIGHNSLKRIDEIINTGKLNELKEYFKKYKNTIKKQKIIDELMEVIGIGHKMALELINKYNILSIDDLISKIKNDNLIVNEKIKLGLKYYGKFKGKIPRKEIDNIYDYLNNINNNKDLTIIICGSYRREEKYSSDIDILLCDLNLLTFEDMKNNNVLINYIHLLKNNGFIIDDITSKNIITKYMGFCKYKNNPIRRIDIRLIPYESIYTAMVYFTGSSNLNQNMRKIAKKLGYKLSEYGLYDDNNNMIYIDSELDLFNKLNMKYLKPNERSI